MTLLVDVAEAPVFSTGGRTWTWSDVFLATRLWGEWDALLDATHDATAPPDAVKQAGRDWRLERRLIAGDELKAWLEERRLDVPAWNAYLRRSVGARKGSVPDLSVAWAQGVCSGVWDRVAGRLAARAAAWEQAGSPAAGTSPPPAWSAGMPSAADALEIGVDPARVVARCAELWAADVALERLRASAAGSDAVAAAVASHNVDWLRVDCDWLEAADQDVAREAALLARVDGVALAEVARRASLALDDRRLYVGDLAPSLQPALISAAPGDLVGPVALDNESDGAWLVAAVRAKVVPSLDDPDIRARAEAVAVEAEVRRAVSERVTWHEHH